MQVNRPLEQRRADIYLLYAARCLRGFGDGFAVVVLPAYLSAIGFATPARFGVRLGRPGGGFDGRMRQMPISENARSAAAIHRKLRGLAAVFLDRAATEHEKANAKILKGRLEKQLSQEATPEGKWTGIMFRLGQGVKEIKSAPSPKADWTDHAFRLGRMLRRGFKR
jgi:hypothetical protein